MAALVPAWQSYDASALDGFTHLSPTDGLPYKIAELASPATYIVFGVLLIAVALLGGRPRDAMTVPVVLLGSTLTSELLKPFVAHPNDAGALGVHEIPIASWPSGHATAAMSLALCAVLVAPRGLRLVTAGLGACFAVAVGFSLLILARHLPTDVIGGYLVAALWVSLGLAAQQQAQRRWPVRSVSLPLSRQGGALHRRSARVRGATALIAFASVAVLAAVGGSQVLAYVSDHPSMIVTAASITALAVAMATSLAFAVSSSQV